MYVGTPKFRTSHQKDDYSCGARCVYMILRHYGIKVPFSKIKDQCLTTPDNGTTVNALIGVLRFYGLEVGVQPKLSITGLRRALKQGAVVLVHVDGDHFAVAYGRDHKYTWVADPNPAKRGKKRNKNVVFDARWTRWGLTVQKK